MLLICCGVFCWVFFVVFFLAYTIILFKKGICCIMYSVRTRLEQNNTLGCCLTLYLIVIQGLLGVGFQCFGNKEKLKSSPLQHLFEVSSTRHFRGCSI